MKIITIIGARPQFVKAAAVSRSLQAVPGLNEVIVHTGQHYDKNMSDIFFEEMKIPAPTYNLSVSGGGHGASTGQMLQKIEETLIKERPDGVLVYGDTNSTLAGALAAKKLHIPLIHVEAGLRSFNMRMPEEINRILTDRISDLLLCPTETAVNNLQKEGFDQFDCKIVRTGDVMQDAAMFYSQEAEPNELIAPIISEEYILSTIHRAENTDDPVALKGIITALNKINQEIKVVVPMHPRTRKVIAQEGIKCEFKVIDPVGYLDMVVLIKNCKLVMTDSGGLQKEAFFFHKNCVTLREQTEWTELIENGYNVLVGSDTDKIIEAYHSMKDKESDFDKDLYGQGKAAENIAEVIKDFFTKQ